MKKIIILTISFLFSISMADSKQKAVLSDSILYVHYGVYIGDGLIIDYCDGIGGMSIRVDDDYQPYIFSSSGFQLNPVSPSQNPYPIYLSELTPEVKEFCDCLVEHDPAGTFSVSWK
ncbi:hypothetical protein [Sphingobacterium faecium]|uniref:hypothetical protein n=1 Tax=Sphingobacterium faecium TaxID=34087 RepID=UPI0032097464